MIVNFQWRWEYQPPVAKWCLHHLKEVDDHRQQNASRDPPKPQYTGIPWYWFLILELGNYERDMKAHLHDKYHVPAHYCGHNWWCVNDWSALNRNRNNREMSNSKKSTESVKVQCDKLETKSTHEKTSTTKATTNAMKQLKKIIFVFCSLPIKTSPEMLLFLSQLACHQSRYSLKCVHKPCLNLHLGQLWHRWAQNNDNQPHH